MELITREYGPNAKGSKLTIQEMDDNLLFLQSLGLDGTSYSFVAADGTPTENGTSLQAAYDAAKLATPYGNALSATNRFTILVSPGNYFTNATNKQFVINTNYIDIKSLTGNADVYLSGITVSASNIYLKGLNTSRAISLGGTKSSFDTPTYNTTQTFDTCVGGNESFGVNSVASGTFINCIGGNFSFGGYIGEAPGTFINCIAGTDSFGGYISSGTFTNCTGGNNSFGVLNSTGVYNNCTGGNFSFGTQGSTGTYINCKAGTNSFTPKDSGYYFSGTAFNCTAQSNSFGPVEGYLYYCKLYGSDMITGGLTLSGASPGKIVLCIDYANSVVTL
jgi:hypothetical protein